MRDLFASVQGYLDWAGPLKSSTSDEIISRVTDRISEIDRTIKAFIHLDPEELKAQSGNVATGTGAALEGVPVAVKTNICIKGRITSCASKMLKDYRAPYTATVIEKLLASGAMVISGTNMDEYAFGSSCETSFFGPTKNPWDISRIPGGSSGGSAAAVAAGEVPLALGSDTGGSIRQPASMCGIVGLKPTYGRVSRSGLVAFASSLDQIGPLARNVKDCAMLLEAIAGFDAKDSTSVERPVDEYSKALKGDVKGLRIGVPEEYFVEGTDREVLNAVKSAIRTYEDLGAEIVEMSLPHTKYAVSCYYIIAPAEASSNLARYDGVHYGYRSRRVEGLDDVYTFSRSEGFGAEVKRRILLGTYALSSGYYEAYYLKAQKVRTKIANDFISAFEKCDIVLTPTAPSTAFKIGERVDDPLKMYLSDAFTIPASLAGLPAISIPCGFDSDSMPIGLQLIAPAFNEGRLLNAAYAFETNTDHHRRKPPHLEVEV